MNKITQTSIELLEGAQDSTVLSIYLPTHRSPSPPHMKEDQIRFKNLVRAGCEQWADSADSALVEQTRRELEARLEDTAFWKDAIDALAIFAGPEGIQMYHLPVECEERVYVGDHFDTTPLRLVEYMNQPAYVFALAQHTPKLFKADLYDIEPIEVDFPKSIEDALNIDEMYANSNTIRAGRTGSSHSVAAAPHGQGDSSEAGHEERLSYLRILDEKMHSSKGFDPKLPLIIAATDTEYGDFHALTRSKTVAPGYIAGNYTDVPLNELHARVRTMLFDTVLDARQQAALEILRESPTAGGVTIHNEAIGLAAKEGRVDSFFLPLIDITTDSVTDRRDAHPLIRFGHDLYQEAARIARYVAQNGGTLIPLQKGITLPKNAPFAAIYRY